jgi:ribonucleoside-diphosphate reductase alpha chain
LVVEESVLMNNATYEDAIKPIVEIARSTSGKLAVADPCELNRQTHFFSTPGWRGSDEYQRSIETVKDMVDLNGKMVLGASWMLGCWHGRGSSKSQILEKKRTSSPVAFAQNYEGRWTGASDGALVKINQLMDCRTLEAPVLSAGKAGDEYYFGVDVARSQNTSNNQSAVVVAKVHRSAETNRITSVDVVNIVHIPNVLNFTAQAFIIKSLAAKYRPRMVVVDGNGLGVGLVDELLKESSDPVTKAPVECWATVNTDKKPEVHGAPRVVFDLKAQGIQAQIITTFINCVESRTLRLLEKKQDSAFTEDDRRDFQESVLPFVQTDFLVEEVSNLKIVQAAGGAMKVERVLRRLDKDRFSALSYVLWYIYEHRSQVRKATAETMQSLFRFRQPRVRN